MREDVRGRKKEKCIFVMGGKCNLQRMSRREKSVNEVMYRDRARS